MDVVHFMRAEGASSAEPHMERQTTTFIKRSLKPAILSVLESTIDSVFVEKSLIAIQDVLHNDGKTIKIDIDGQTFNVNLGLFQGNTKVAGRKEFITFVESYLIPWLKIGKLHKDDPTNVKLMENNFIKNLKRKESFNQRKKRSYIWSFWS